MRPPEACEAPKLKQTPQPQRHQPQAPVHELSPSSFAPHPPERLVEYPQFGLPADPVPGAVGGRQGEAVRAYQQELQLQQPHVPGSASKDGPRRSASPPRR